MRIALVSPAPQSTQVDKFGWLAEAFQRIGHEPVRAHSLDGALAADQTCPLVVFSQYNAGTNDADLVQHAQRGNKRAVWLQFWFDLIAIDPAKPLAEQDQIRSLGGFMRAMDIVGVKERGLLAEYRRLGIVAVWLDQACPANMPACEHPAVHDWDVLLWGTLEREQRMADVQALLRAGLKLAWAGLPGSGYCPEGVEPLGWYHPLALPAITSRAACVLSIDYRLDLDGYCSDRFWLAAGMGACIVRRRAIGQPIIECTDYDTGSGLVEIVHWLRPRAGVRRRLGTRARAATLAEHTYENRAREIIDLYNRRVGL